MGLCGLALTEGPVAIWMEFGGPLPQPKGWPTMMCLPSVSLLMGQCGSEPGVVVPVDIRMAFGKPSRSLMGWLIIGSERLPRLVTALCGLELPMASTVIKMESGQLLQLRMGLLTIG